MNPIVGPAAGGTTAEPSVGELAASIVVVGGLWLAVGPIGLAIGVGTALVWVCFGTPYALATGFVGLAAAVPTLSFGDHWVLVTLLGFGLLLASGYRTGAPIRVGAAALATATGLVAIVWATLSVDPTALWIPGLLVLLTTIVLVAIGNRYERLTLDLRVDDVAMNDGGAAAAVPSSDPEPDPEPASNDDHTTTCETSADQTATARP